MVRSELLNSRENLTIKERIQSIVNYTDDLVLELWEAFEEIGINRRGEIVSEFHEWSAGTSKDTILKWFDCTYSSGVASLLD